MALLSPPPVTSPLATKNGIPAPPWLKWLQQTFQTLSGTSPPASLIVASHVSPTTDLGTLQAGDKVLVIPAAAGNCHFVTVATAGTLPEAAVVGSLYVVLRAI